MSMTRQAAEVLERDFPAIRHQILNVAAALDRIARAEGGDAVGEDARMVKIREAIEVLGESGESRAERVQLVFSRAYDPQWRR